ncbi:hypothetical protein PG991_015693 [Apiospora marii]|uniref:Uncharacterized protein n=1 Tax=Apiospora marii TaxID=335849 RepID=A0ABR1R2J3_9PEZI
MATAGRTSTPRQRRELQPSPERRGDDVETSGHREGVPPRCQLAPRHRRSHLWRGRAPAPLPLGGGFCLVCRHPPGSNPPRRRRREFNVIPGRGSFASCLGWSSSRVLLRIGTVLASCAGWHSSRIVCWMEQFSHHAQDQAVSHHAQDGSQFGIVLGMARSFASCSGWLIV